MTKREYLIALAMLVGGVAPAVGIGFISLSIWAGGVAGILFWPCTIVAGLIADAA